MYQLKELPVAELFIVAKEAPAGSHNSILTLEVRLSSQVIVWVVPRAHDSEPLGVKAVTNGNAADTI